MDLHAAAGFAEAMGISLLHPPKVKASDLSEMDRGRAADAGFRAVTAGPNGLREALSKLTAAEAHRRGYWGLRDTYGHAYGLLQKTLDDPAYEAFREVVQAHALENVPIEPGTDVLGVKPTTRTLHTVRSAAMTSGAHARTIRRYFERKGLAGNRKENRHNRPSRDRRGRGDREDRQGLKGCTVHPAGSRGVRYPARPVSSQFAKSRRPSSRPVTKCWKGEGTDSSAASMVVASAGSTCSAIVSEKSKGSKR